MIRYHDGAKAKVAPVPRCAISMSLNPSNGAYLNISTISAEDKMADEKDNSAKSDWKSRVFMFFFWIAVIGLLLLWFSDFFPLSMPWRGWSD